MADDQKNPASEEEKSINDLLKEYAGDVKDKDLDDFLQGDDDAFESEDDDAEDESDKVLAEAGQPRKSGGLLTMLLIVVAFGAAGAGAWVYLNRDDGMTSIMGGFGGGAPDAPVAGLEMDMSAPAPVLPPVDTAAPTMPETPAQPMPIMNDTADAPMPAPGADLLSATAVPMPEPVLTQDAAPALGEPALADDASLAVDAWVSGTDTLLSETAPLPEQPVAELKAKPPVTASARREPVKTATPAAAAPKTEAPKTEAPRTASPQQEPAAPRQAAAPARATTTSATTNDGALPPPYVAIQARQSGAETPARPAASAAAAPVARPIVEGARHSASGTGRDVEGNRNQNVADVTQATGETAAMIAKGGGIIELGTTVIPAPNTVPAPVGHGQPVRQPQPSTPELRTVPLAIQGGRSVPPGAASVETRAYAEIPATTQGTRRTTPASQPLAADEPRVPAVPVEPVRAVAPQPPLDDAPAYGSRAASAPANDARAILAQAVAAEKAGHSGDALELYQKALEVDAVYGDGRSIDRGMVYDRIGAIRAGR